MKTMYQVKARYSKQVEEGVKTVSEVYLVDAESVTEAEVGAIDYLKPYTVSGGCLEIIKAVEDKYEEVIEGGEDYYYKVKVEMITLDEKTAKEVKRKHTLLINADSVERAVAIYQSQVKSEVTDMRLLSIAECPILSIIRPL